MDVAGIREALHSSRLNRSRSNWRTVVHCTCVTLIS